MATHIDYDTSNRVMYVITAPTGGTLTLDVKQDIYSAVKKDWHDQAALNKFKLPWLPEGGFIITGAKTLTPYYRMRSGWTMRPYEANHTLYLENGILLEETGADPWVQTLGGYTVNIRDVVPSDAQTIAVTTGALTPEQDTILRSRLSVGQFISLKNPPLR